jgi:hypothetical protein
MRKPFFFFCYTTHLEFCTRLSSRDYIIIMPDQHFSKYTQPNEVKWHIQKSHDTSKKIKLKSKDIKKKGQPGAGGYKLWCYYY